MASGERDGPEGLGPNVLADYPQRDPDLGTWRKYLHRPRDISAIALVGIFLFSLVAFLYFAKPFLMPVILALLFNFLLKPVVRSLTRLHVPQGISAAVVLICFVGLLAFGISKLTEPAAEWISKAPDSLREARLKVRHLLQPAERLTQAAAQVENITKPSGGEYTPQVEIKKSNLFDSVFDYTKSFLAGTLETLVLLYFLLASGDVFMRKLVKVMPTLHDKQNAVEITHDVQHNISTFLFTITLINTGLGILIGVGMYLVGIPNPILWGVVGGLLNFIPYFGPLMGVIVLTIVGLLTFETVGHALAPPSIYLALHAIESNFVTPLILGRRLTLNPVLIFVSLIFWSWLWGMPGALLAVPMLMVLKIFCDHFQALAPIGELLSGKEPPLVSEIPGVEAILGPAEAAGPAAPLERAK